ncbi:hypothetical protein NL676_011954 [Syzygium grande]|nr:hypothetical protein NL676_011954 [Syzygium grande]
MKADNGFKSGYMTMLEKWFEEKFLGSGIKGAASLRGKSFPQYDQLATVFGKDRAKGNLSEDPSEAHVAVDHEESTFGSFLEKANERMEMIASRIGHAKDLDNDKRKVNEELLQMSLGDDRKAFVKLLLQEMIEENE